MLRKLSFLLLLILVSLNLKPKALSHIAYFSYEVNTATGGYTTIHEWNTTPLIDFAHQRGTKVLLTVTNFGTAGNTEILSDTIKQKFLINNLIYLLKSRNGDGVNFDFESVALSQQSTLQYHAMVIVRTRHGLSIQMCL